jgi:hypothetical protein
MATARQEPELTDAEKRQAQKRLQVEFERRVTVLAAQLAIGLLSISAWLRLFSSELRSYHLAAALIISDGGVTPLVRQIVTVRVARELGFLRAFATEMENGRFPVDAEARIRLRSRLYSGSGFATFEEVRLRMMGLPTLPAYPKDGQSDCRHNCTCLGWDIIQLEGDGNWDCFWRLGTPDSDHCEQCPERAKVWFPLMVRGGVIQPYQSVGLFRV